MNRKISLSLAISCMLFAADMPPMPPMPLVNVENSKPNETKSIKNVETEQKKRKNQVNQAPAMPKECEVMPPMIVFLPPPMEEDLTLCKNALNKPKLENVKKVYKDATSVDIAEGFKELYKITLKNKKELYCNSTLSSCLEVKKVIKNNLNQTKEKNGK